ncbi:MAG: hypothetical protein ACTTJS_01965 [Wolinella sp.]
MLHQHRPLVIALSLLTMIVVGVVSSIYIRIVSDTENLKFASQLNMENEQKSGSNATLSWMSRFSSKEIPDYLYPAPELHVKLSFPNAPEDVLKTFQVVVGELDSYRFFCLNQVLVAHKIDYAYYKTGGHIRLIVTTKDESYLRSVLKELRRYEISYELHQS